MNPASFQLLTFDCYGTLIDWVGGIRRAVSAVAARAGLRLDPEALNAAYMRIEPQAQRPPWRPYREVLVDVLYLLGRELGFAVAPADASALADSLPDWPPFSDTNAALARLKQRCRLGILSNIDRDLITQTVRHFSVDFDRIVTAEDVRAYKPCLAHFLRLRETENPAPGAWLHVAQSLFHDIAPCNELGIPCVWINRQAERNDTGPKPSAEFPDLASFADWLLASGRS